MRGEEFKRHILETYDISDRSFERLLEEFRGFFGLAVEDFVRARHGELQHQGYKNEESFRLIAKEAKDHRFAVKPLSLRRIRRIIYG